MFLPSPTILPEKYETSLLEEYILLPKKPSTELILPLTLTRTSTVARATVCLWNCLLPVLPASSFLIPWSNSTTLPSLHVHLILSKYRTVTEHIPLFRKKEEAGKKLCVQRRESSAAWEARKEAVCNETYAKKAESTGKREPRKAVSCSSSWPTFSLIFPFTQNKIFGREPLKPVPTTRTELKKDIYCLETIILMSPPPTLS